MARLSATVDSQDVTEAIRLVREALLSYAIDPLTGKIDMDLINTGKSLAVREKIDHIKDSIKDILGRKTGAIDYQALFSDLRAIASGNSAVQFLKS